MLIDILMLSLLILLIIKEIKQLNIIYFNNTIITTLFICVVIQFQLLLLEFFFTFMKYPSVAYHLGRQYLSSHLLSSSQP